MGRDLLGTGTIHQKSGSAADPEVRQVDLAAPQGRAPGRADAGQGGVTEVLHPRRTACLASALGRRYRLERLIAPRSIIASYAAAATDGIGREVEMHVAQLRVATMASSSHF
jgi:hypothetical protein